MTPDGYRAVSWLVALAFCALFWGALIWGLIGLYR